MNKIPSNIRIITYCWGKEHVDLLLQYNLTTLLSPDNLPILSTEFNVELCIITEIKYFEYIKNDIIYNKLKKICKVLFIPIDDLLTEPWQYGFTVANKLFRGIQDVGDDMINTYFLLLNVDFLISNGSYKNLIPKIKNGEKIILAPSYCVNSEDVIPILDSKINKLNCELNITSREMAQIIIDNIHNTIKSKIIDNDIFHFEIMDQFYYKISNEVMFGRQMAMALVGLQPEIILNKLNLFWDWGMCYEFCPSLQFTIISDSDEFLMLELREKKKHKEMIVISNKNNNQIVKKLNSYMTKYQMDTGKFTFCIHSRALNSFDKKKTIILDNYVEELYLNLSPVSSVNNESWLYHKNYFLKYNNKTYSDYELSIMDKYSLSTAIALSNFKHNRINYSSNLFKQKKIYVKGSFESLLKKFLLNNNNIFNPLFSNYYFLSKYLKTFRSADSPRILIYTKSINKNTYLDKIFINYNHLYIENIELLDIYSYKNFDIYFIDCNLLTDLNKFNFFINKFFEKKINKQLIFYEVSNIFKHSNSSNTFDHDYVLDLLLSIYDTAKINNFNLQIIFGGSKYTKNLYNKYKNKNKFFKLLNLFIGSFTQVLNSYLEVINYPMTKYHDSQVSFLIEIKKNCEK